MKSGILKNGTVVVNFSSPHSFTFDDGTVIEACSRDEVEKGSLKEVEMMEVVLFRGHPAKLIKKEFVLTEEVEKLLLEALELGDVVLVPRVILEVVKSDPRFNRVVCADVDRTSKLCSSTSFVR